MKILLALSRAVDQMSDWIGRHVIWLIFASVLISAGNAISRKVFSASSNAWLEAQWYLFGAAFMLGAAYTLKENEHIRIDIIYGKWSRRTQHWIDLFGHVVFLLPFAALMAWMLYPYMMDAIRSGQISTNASGLIIWPARAILFAGFVLLVLQALSEAIKKIAMLQGLMDDPHPHQSAAETTLIHVEELTGQSAKDTAK
ncbi:MAG: TRAP transporter small permease subunit [Cypionkella sp.]|nr:TRAP transporter small permease subunit [Cypionkella sp.]